MANNIDTLNNGPIAETPGEQVSVQDAFTEAAFPEAHSENSSTEQPQVTPHPIQNQNPITETAEQPVQETPVQNRVTQTSVDNDERRYQYWQSQAAKANNQLKQQQAQLEQFKAAQGQAQQVEQPTEYQQENTFPPAPLSVNAPPVN